MRRDVHNTQDGFSLIEVLIALLILAGGFVGLARLQMGMLTQTSASVLNDTAIRLAEDKLASLRFDLAAGRPIGSGNDALLVHGMVLQRSWTWGVVGELAETEITLRWHEPSSDDARSLDLPAKLLLPDLGAQAWLIQSGPPTRETLP
jgi:prepilin-type N-terminal cleavage/methylation domain-containing protein